MPAITGSGRGARIPLKVQTGLLAFADFNGDGRLDAVTANQRNDTVTVFLNAGDGNFGAPQGRRIATGRPRTGLLFADLDGNDRLDIVSFSDRTSDGRRMIVTALNDGNGHFSDLVSSEAMEPVIGDMALGDFRNTGELDLVAVGTEQEPFVCFFPNAGSGGFGPRVCSGLDDPLAAGLLAVGDFDRDGKLDFIAAWQRVTLFRGQGNGTFVRAGSFLPEGISLSDFPVLLHAADFDHDGKLDLLIHFVRNQIFGNNNVFVLPGDGFGGFGTPRIILRNSGAVEVADLNGDGLLDLVEAADPTANYPEPTASRVVVHLGEQGGGFRKAGEYTSFAGWLDSPEGGQPSLMVGDFNGDGHQDVVISADNVMSADLGRRYQFLAGRGDGSFTPCYQMFEEYQAIGMPQFAADLTGDGRTDLVVAGERFASLHVLVSVPAVPFQLTALSPVLGETAVGRVTLDQPAGRVTDVALRADRPEIRLPQSVSILSGQRVVDFEYTIDSAFDWRTAFSISAEIGGERREVTVYQWPKRALYFPQIADGVSGSIRFHSEITLANVAGGGSAELEFFDSDGNPLAVELPGHGTSQVFRFQLRQGESLRLQTSGQGPLRVGYLRAVADLGIDGTVVYVRSNLQGVVLYEAGVGASPPGTRGTLLVDLREPRSTAIAMVNVAGAGRRDATEPRSSRVRLRLYDENFELLGSRDLALQPGEHQALFVPELFNDVDPERLRDLHGTLTFQSEQLLAAVTLLQSDAAGAEFPTAVPNLTTYPVARRSADGVFPSEDPPRSFNEFASRAPIIPQVASGCSGDTCLRTQFSLMNPGPDAWIRLELYDPSGQPIEIELSGLGKKSRFDVYMRSGEARSFETPGAGPLVVAFARLRIGEAVEAVAVFTRFDRQSGRVFYRTGVPATPPCFALSIAVDSLGDADTGIAIVNKTEPNVATAANLELRLYDRQFQLLAETNVALGANQQMARFVGELFRDFAGAREMEGILTVHSDFPIAAITLRQHESAVPFPAFVPLLTTFPVFKGSPD
jgi:hypothetical protein